MIINLKIWIRRLQLKNKIFALKSVVNLDRSRGVNFIGICIQGENFIAVTLDYNFIEKYFDRDLFPPFLRHWYHDIIEFYRPSLLLPSAIRHFATNGITNENKPFIFDSNDNDYTYDDNDRIGLQIRR
jgi:hypothetical protein